MKTSGIRAKLGEDDFMRYLGGFGIYLANVAFFVILLPTWQS